MSSISIQILYVMLPDGDKLVVCNQVKGETCTL